MFNVVMIVPTGVGAEIGGFCGDATPAAKLLAGCCDNLITHPNVVNGADLNEMSENTLYVEGSILDRFLEGRIKLKTPSSQNKILVVGNSPLPTITVNAVSAARATMGINAEILPLNTPLEMTGWIEGDHATGDVYGWEELVEQVKQHQFDALAIHTPIKVDRELQIHYFKNGGIMRSSEARKEGIHPQTLSRMVETERLVKEERGLYRDLKVRRVLALRSSRQTVARRASIKFRT